MRATSMTERQKEKEALKLEHRRLERTYFLQKAEDGRVVTWNPFLDRRKAEFSRIRKTDYYAGVEKKKAATDAIVDVEPFDEEEFVPLTTPEGESIEIEEAPDFIDGPDEKAPEAPAPEPEEEKPEPVNKPVEELSTKPKRLNTMSKKQLVEYINASGERDRIVLKHGGLSTKSRPDLLKIVKEI